MNGLIELKKDAAFLNRLYWFLFLGPLLVYFSWGLTYYGLTGLLVELQGVGLPGYCLGFVSLMIFHEALHVLAAMMAGVQLSSITFQVDKDSLAINCVCKEQLSIGAYLFFLVLPCIVLTVVYCYAVFTSEGQLWPLMLALSTSGCAFDLVAFVGILGISTATMIIPEFESKDGRVYLRAAPR